MTMGEYYWGSLKEGILLIAIFLFGVCLGVTLANRNRPSCQYSRIIYMEAQ